MHFKYSIFLVFILIGCNTTPTKPEQKQLVEEPTVEIEKETIDIYTLQSEDIMDSSMLNNESFSKFRTTIEDLSKLNQEGLEPFLNDALINCNQLLKEKLPLPYDVPEVKGRLKVVKTQLIKARFHSEEKMQLELNQSLRELYIAYSAYLKRIDGITMEEISSDSIDLN